MPAFKKINKKGAGRPPMLNDELIEKICKVLRLGVYVETAVVVNGIPKATFYDWAKRAHDGAGKRKNNIYSKLLDAVDKAQEEATTRDIINIDKCAIGQEFDYERNPDGSLVLNGRGNPIPKKLGVAPDWQASAWRLERRKPKQWSKTERIEHTGKDGGPISTADETPEQKSKRKQYIDSLKSKVKLLDE